MRQNRFVLAESLLTEHGARSQHEERQQALERMLLQPLAR
jgi:hypothetical protein